MSYQQPPQGYYQPQPGFVTPAPRKKRRVFLWIFLAIQVLFIIWIIAGAASGNGGVSSQVTSFCGNHGWFPLYKSYADCLSSYGRLLNDAGNTGKGIGVALVIAFWCIVDFLVGGGYAIYRLASRRSS